MCLCINTSYFRLNTPSLFRINDQILIHCGECCFILVSFGLIDILMSSGIWLSIEHRKLAPAQLLNENNTNTIFLK